MSKSTQNKDEKVLTKYDLKMQRREEAKKQADREKLISTITGIVVVLALLVFVLSFPIRNYLTVNGTYVKVGGENVSRVEFDYHYNSAKNNYISQYSYYMSMFGLDLSGDLSQQMYSEDLSWKDYFDQLAVDSIVKSKALRDQAKAAGFTYDASADYAEYEKNLKAAASEAGKSEKAYIQELYGTYATVSRVKPLIMQGLINGQYYDSIAKSKEASDEEIRAYYEANKADYDSVDYRLITITAELPTEPTELADPVDNTENTESTETTEGEEKAYVPSDAEIEQAMKVAKAEAEEKVKTVSTEGDLRENMTKSSTSSYYRDWLFSEDRKAGDTTIVENETSHMYYVVSFEKRYLDETVSVDARVIMPEEGQDGQAILDEWKSGVATEESFAELADKYNDASLGLEGGLFEALVSDSMPADMKVWAYSGNRQKGDTAVITQDESVLVVYYLGENKAEWKLNIANTLLSDAMYAYMDEISAGYDVEDSKGRLKYLTVETEEETSENTAE